MVEILRRLSRPFLGTHEQNGRDASPLALPAAESCLFIVGAARSGSTVLQNALNDSPDIFLIGEANFHTDPGTPDFIARYNAMHRAWGNQETKSSFCPPLLAGDGRWDAYLRRLAGEYRLVGSKTVITAAGADDSAEKWFSFHCRNFYRARVIFTFRDPLATLFSTQELQRHINGHTESLSWVMRNYLAIVSLYLRCLRSLPNVQALCHEDVDQASFARLSDWLGVPLPNAPNYYDSSRVRHYDDTRLDDASRQIMAPISSLYASLRQGVREGFALPQLDQNNTHLIDSHFTPLGRLARETERLMASLPQS